MARGPCPAPRVQRVCHPQHHSQCMGSVPSKRMARVEACMALGREEWDRLGRAYTARAESVGPDESQERWAMNCKTFLREVLRAPDSSESAQRLFQSLGGDYAGILDRDQFLDAVAVLCDGDRDRRARILFNMCRDNYHKDTVSISTARRIFDDVCNLKFACGPGSDAGEGDRRLDYDAFRDWAAVHLAPLFGRWNFGAGVKRCASANAGSERKVLGAVSMESDEVGRTVERGDLGPAARGQVFDGHGLGSPVAGRGGLIGLYNLGNTCFLNASVQALSATPPLREYFVRDLYANELNFSNPLGMKAKVPLCYGALVKKMWREHGENNSAPLAVTPRTFKAALERFSPMFRGYEQHDAQELLAFLLDGIHEGLNRVHDKPSVPTTDSAGRSDTVVAEEHWRAYLKRNRSVIVDLFTGQLKSTLQWDCGFTNSKFDPFQILSLPIPLRRIRFLRILVVFASSRRRTTAYSMRVLPGASISSVRQQLGALCGVESRRLLLCDVYLHRVWRFLSSSSRIEDIEETDRIVAYEMSPVRLSGKRPRKGRAANTQKPRSRVDMWLGERVDVCVGHDKENERVWVEGKVEAMARTGWVVLRLLQPREELVHESRGRCVWMSPKQAATRIAHHGTYSMRPFATEILSILPRAVVQDSTAFADTVRVQLYADPILLFLCSNITQDELYAAVMEKLAALGATSEGKSAEFVLRWCDRTGRACGVCPWTAQCAGCLIKRTSAPLRIRTGASVALEWQPQDTRISFPLALDHASTKRHARAAGAPLSLDECLEQFCVAETLNGQSAPRCPKCKRFHRATKTLRLYKFPPFLIIHLKRLLPTGKLHSMVDFPLEGLQLPVPTRDDGDVKAKGKVEGKVGAVYDLYAVVNHFGNAQGGHYVAYAARANIKGEKRWFRFDDECVAPVEDVEGEVKTRSAYMLFYHRRDAFTNVDPAAYLQAELKSLDAQLPDSITQLLARYDEAQEADENFLSSLCTIV